MGQKGLQDMEVTGEYYQAIWYDVAIILYSKYLALERLLIAYTDCLVHMARRKI